MTNENKVFTSVLPKCKFTIPQNGLVDKTDIATSPPKDNCDIKKKRLSDITAEQPLIIYSPRIFAKVGKSGFCATIVPSGAIR